MSTGAPGTPGGSWYLGIEIGGTKLQLAAGPSPNKLAVVRKARVNPSAGAEGIRAQIASEFPHLAYDDHGQPRTFRAVGIGFGGPIDAARGRTVRSHQVHGWEDYPLADWARQTLKIETVVLGNDADLAALAEARLGAGRGLSPVIYLTIGSGVGGGLVIHGQLYQGQGQGAMEIGHLAVGPDGAALETIASGWGITRQVMAILQADPRAGTTLRDLVDGELDAITTEVIGMAASLGDATARTVLQTARQALAQALGHAITLLAPRVVILGGGVSLLEAALWLDPLKPLVAEKVFAPFRNTYELRTAALGELVVLHGAIAHAQDHQPQPQP